MRARSILYSFNYALQGIVYALRTQRNMRLHILAAFSEWQNDTHLAELVYRRILQLAPDTHLASNNLAMVLRGDPHSLDEALVLATRALNTVPDNADYKDTLQRLLIAKTTVQQNDSSLEQDAPGRPEHR